VLEDLTIRDELRPGADLQRLYVRVRRFSIPKWSLSALTGVLLAPIMRFGEWSVALGVLALLTSATAVWTLRRARRRPQPPS